MNLTLANNLYLDSKKQKGLINTHFVQNEETKFFGVLLSLDVKPEIHIFNSLESSFRFGENKDLYYSFLQDETNGLFIIEREGHNQNHFIGGRNIYNINNEWNLFLNSKNDIAVQKNKSPFTTIRFRYFPKNKYFFVKLSYLYYCLRNHSFTTKDDLETKFKSLIIQ